jgi:hypothetical protein
MPGYNDRYVGNAVKVIFIIKSFFYYNFQGLIIVLKLTYRCDVYSTKANPLFLFLSAAEG